MCENQRKPHAVGGEGAVGGADNVRAEAIGSVFEGIALHRNTTQSFNEPLVWSDCRGCCLTSPLSPNRGDAEASPAEIWTSSMILLPTSKLLKNHSVQLQILRDAILSP